MPGSGPFTSPTEWCPEEHPPGPQPACCCAPSSNAELSGCFIAGTEKVRQAQECGQLHVVNPDWLWSCLERWDKVEEQLFPLQDDHGRGQR